MPAPNRVVVTGAFSYTGSYIARAFLAAGSTVSTLTRHLQRPHPLQGNVVAFPLDFSKPDQLAENLKGQEVLVNTYWIRYEYPGSSFAQAVENSRVLFDAAIKAGVRRIIHISVSNPGPNLPYFEGKQRVEELVLNSGMSYAILRPTIVFGHEEVLINNITWLLRHIPLFAIPGSGAYRVQPVYVKDLADLVVQLSAQSQDQLVDVAGPEIFNFKELIRLLVKITRRRVLLVSLPRNIALLLSQVVGALLGDVMLTGDELAALMEERLVIGDQSICQTKFSDWARQHADTLGVCYVNELVRHHGKGRSHA